MHFRNRIASCLLHADDLFVGYAEASENSDVIASPVDQINAALNQLRFLRLNLISRYNHVVSEISIVEIGSAPRAARLSTGEHDDSVAFFDGLVDDEKRSAVTQGRPITKIRERNDEQNEIQEIDSLSVPVSDCGRFHAGPQPPPPGV